VVLYEASDRLDLPVDHLRARGGYLAHSFACAVCGKRVQVLPGQAYGGIQLVHVTKGVEDLVVLGSSLPVVQGRLTPVPSLGVDLHCLQDQDQALRLVQGKERIH